MSDLASIKSKLSGLIILKMVKDKCWMSVYQTLSICGESLDKEDRDKILEILDGDLNEELEKVRKALNK